MKETVLENGLTIVSEENKNSKVCTLAYVIKSGSYDEQEHEHGIAHLIEHMMFKGTIHRTYKQIAREIESIGGRSNAATSFEYTKYYCTVPSLEWKVGLDVLSDMLFNSTLLEEELEKEKKVVQEELKMYSDDPGSFVNDKLIEEMFKGFSNRQSIGGTTETVGKLIRDDLVDFIDRNYFPENMIFIATGNINHNEIVNFIKDYMEKLNINFNNYQKQFKKFERRPLDTKIINFERNDIEQTHLAFGLFGPEYSSKDALPLQLLTIMLGGNSSSILFDIIREQKGLAYSISLDSEAFNDSGIIMGYAGLNKESDIIDEILKQFKDVKENIDEEILESTKVYLIGMLYLKLEKTSGVNDFLTDQLIHNDKDSIETVIALIKKITMNDIHKTIDAYFSQDNICFVKLN